MLLRVLEPQFSAWRVERWTSSDCFIVRVSLWIPSRMNKSPTEQVTSTGPRVHFRHSSCHRRHRMAGPRTSAAPGSLVAVEWACLTPAIRHRPSPSLTLRHEPPMRRARPKTAAGRAASQPETSRPESFLSSRWRRRSPQCPPRSSCADTSGKPRRPRRRAAPARPSPYRVRGTPVHGRSMPRYGPRRGYLPTAIGIRPSE